MKSQRSADSRERIRPKVLWMAWLALIAVIAAIVFFRANRHVTPQRQTGVVSPGNAVVSNSSPLRNDSAKQFFQPAAPQSKPDSDQLISETFNQTLPLQLRRQAARSLAKLG